METVSNDLQTIKQKIWKLCKQSIINVHVAADKAKVRLPLSSIADAQAILAVLCRKPKPRPPVPQWVKDRYNEAHRVWVGKETPSVIADGHYCPPIFPPVHKSGGLTKFIVNYATWTGNYGNRINTMGYKGPDGKWRKTTTKKGTSDTMLCVAGRMVCLEVKIGPDIPSDKQLAQQRSVRASGGIYEFVRTAEDVLNIFDQLLYG